VPRPRLAFTVNADQPRATINTVWLSFLPGPAGGGGDDDGPRGWAAVVAAWVPRLMPALRTALFHGPSGPATAGPPDRERGRLHQFAGGQAGHPRREEGQRLLHLGRGQSPPSVLIGALPRRPAHVVA